MGARNLRSSGVDRTQQADVPGGIQKMTSKEFITGIGKPSMNPRWTGLYRSCRSRLGDGLPANSLPSRNGLTNCRLMIENGFGPRSNWRRKEFCSAC